ncbi:MAG TPA: hypothetical protein VFZ66_00265 [Herpetosiphonaceae bacterium]
MSQHNQPVVVLARQQLADTLGCDAQAVQIVDVEEMEWSDSSLGCPQPGMMYMQVITPGYRVTLEHSGQRYIFHTDLAHRAIRCDPSGRRASDMVR